MNESEIKNLKSPWPLRFALIGLIGVVLVGFAIFNALNKPSPTQNYTPHEELIGKSFTTVRDGVLRLNELEGKTTDLVLIEHMGEQLDGDISIVSGTQLKIDGVRKIMKSSTNQRAVLVGQFESGPENSRRFEYLLGEYRSSVPRHGFGAGIDHPVWIFPPAIWSHSEETTIWTVSWWKRTHANIAS